jgi:hypothetical protein
MSRRPMYRPERAPARKLGVLNRQAPIACPDATPEEIAMALFSIGEQAHMIPGQGGTYDSLKDLYTLIGKALDGGFDAAGVPTGRVQEIQIEGSAVAALIWTLRGWNGGRYEKGAILKELDRKRTRFAKAG